MKQNMKRFFLLLVVLVTSLSMTVIVYAATDMTKAETKASALKQLGLFKGVSDADFALNRAPTRTEALVMLIRVLGQESVALNGSWSHPFTDVTPWADKYVGYAYKKGLTKGISATQFGRDNANFDMYMTFVLRALNYDDAAGDFVWNAPDTLATTVGVLPSGVDNANFMRADVVMVSWAALEAKLKDGSKTLAEKLISSNVFTTEQYSAAKQMVVESSVYTETGKENKSDKPTSSGKLELAFGNPDNVSSQYQYQSGIKLDMITYATFKAEKDISAKIIYAATDNTGNINFSQNYDFKGGETYILQYTFAFSGNTGSNVAAYAREFTVEVGGAKATLKSNEAGVLKATNTVIVRTLAEWNAYIDQTSPKEPFMDSWRDSEGKYEITITKNSGSGKGNSFNGKDFFYAIYSSEYELRINIDENPNDFITEEVMLKYDDIKGDVWNTVICKNRLNKYPYTWQEQIPVTLYRVK